MMTPSEFRCISWYMHNFAEISYGMRILHAHLIGRVKALQYSFKP